MPDTQQPSRPSIDQRTFRNTMGLFATGVAVIATRLQGDNEVHAMTANAVTSLSLDPMLLLFCPSKQSSLAKYLPQICGFSINILRDQQRDLSTYFAGGWKQADAPPFTFVDGTHEPYLQGSLASLECTLHQVVDGGDHWVIIGRVLALHQGAEPYRPLLYFKGQYWNADAPVSSGASDL